MKISFDFDGTINDIPEIEDFCKELIVQGEHDIYIITRRYDIDNRDLGIVDEHLDVLRLADRIGLPHEKIFFMNRAYKIEKIVPLGIDVHIDDDLTEIRIINKSAICSAVCVHNYGNRDEKHWKEMIIELLNL